MTIAKNLIHGKILMLIKDFLSNREQQIVLNGHISHSVPVTSGVPQGSVLGPVLFTMFVNDIPSIVLSPVYLFADDTKVFRVIRNREDYLALQNDLNLLYNWPLTWQLTFNILKCKHLHLGPPHHFEPYHINSLEIDRVASHKAHFFRNGPRNSIPPSKHTS